MSLLVAAELTLQIVNLLAFILPNGALLADPCYIWQGYLLGFSLLVRWTCWNTVRPGPAHHDIWKRNNVLAKHMLNTESHIATPCSPLAPGHRPFQKVFDLLVQSPEGSALHCSALLKLADWSASSGCPNSIWTCNYRLVCPI